MEHKMTEKAMQNADECEKKGDLIGKEKWMNLALLAEQFYINKEKKDGVQTR